jgi:hypothetical protein
MSLADICSQCSDSLTCLTAYIKPCAVLSQNNASLETCDDNTTNVQDLER